MSIEAMKMALKALEQTPTANKLFDESNYEKQKEAIEALRQAIEQAEKQEPVVWMYNGTIHEFDPSDWATIAKVTPLYTAPPKREWVGLTNEEKRHARETVTYRLFDMTAAEWAEEVQKETERRLKEKNT